MNVFVKPSSARYHLSLRCILGGSYTPASLGLVEVVAEADARRQRCGRHGCTSRPVIDQAEVEEVTAEVQEQQRLWGHLR